MRAPRRIDRTRALALCCLATFAACTSAPKAKVDPEKMLELHREMALRYFDQGEIDRAEDQVRRGLDLDPKDDQLKLMLGWIHQRRGTRDDVQIAEKIFRAQLKTKDYRAELGLAEALERKGVLYTESADAIASGARETKAADPKARAAELRQSAEGFWRESIQMYEKVLERRPDDPQAFNGLQRVYAWKGDTEKSLEYARALIDRAAAELDFWDERLQGVDITAEDENNIREIVRNTTRLLVETHLHASALLVRLGRKTEAVEELDEVLRLDPDRAEAYSRRASLLQELGRYAEAIPNIDEFLRLSQLEFDHPDIRRAFQLRSDCTAALDAAEPTAR